MGDELLTEAEHRCVRLLAEAWDVYALEVCGEGPAREGDCREFAAHIHDLQRAVLKQAAARAYPDLYRLAGMSLDDASEPRGWSTSGAAKRGREFVAPRVPADEFGTALRKVGEVMAASVDDLGPFRAGLAAMVPGARDSIEFGVAIDEYYVYVEAIGFDRERAGQILDEAMTWLTQSWDPKATWRDAMARARQAVILEASGL